MNTEYQIGKGRHKKISHSLFIDNLKLYVNSKNEAKRLANPARIFSKDIAIDFGINKCARVTMKGRKLVSVGGLELSSGEVIPDPESYKDYKNLGIFDTNDIIHTEMKIKI